MSKGQPSTDEIACPNCGAWLEVDLPLDDDRLIHCSSCEHTWKQPPGTMGDETDNFGVPLPPERTTILEEDGVEVRIRGTGQLSPEGQKALRDICKAAYRGLVKGRT